MVICSFFLKGQCRFGESCKNEHSYNSNNSSVLLKKPEVDVSMLIKFASGDMLKAEKGNQWPLSCYGPYQAKPSFPGFEDKSFEEIRLGFYEAQRNGNIDQYKEQLAQILHEARIKIKSLQNPTAEATNVLKDIYYSNNTGNQQKNLFGNQHTANVFNNSSSNASSQNSIFNKSQTTSIFGAPAQSNQTSANKFSFQSQNSSIFGNKELSNQSQPSNNIFNNATTNQNAFGSNTQSIFGVTNQSQTNQPFGSNSTFQKPLISNTPTNHSASIFGSNQGNINVFNSNSNSPASSIFGSNTTAPSTNVFSSSTNTATNSNTFAPSNNGNPGIFGSNMSTATTAQTNSIFGNGPFASTQQNNPTNVNPFLNATQNIPAVTGISLFSNSNSNTNIPSTQNSAFNLDKSQSYSASIFGNRASSTMGTVKKDDTSIYSRISDLNANDISQYEKESFDFGCIPVRAPAIEMY